MRRSHTDLPSTIQALAHLPDIRSMAMLRYEPVWSTEWHRSWCCEFHYILNDKLIIKLKNGRRITGATSELLLVPSGLLHRDDYHLDAFPRVFMLFFSWNMERQFWRYFTPAERQTLRIPFNREITAMFDSIQTTLSSGTPADEIITRAYVLAILLLIIRTRQTAVSSPFNAANVARRRRQAIMLEAKRYVEQHYREYVALDSIAKALKISPYYLSHVFSRESDFSLFEYLAGLRMRQALLLLQKGDLKVKEVAGAVGYDDVGCFSKAFQRHYGIPPRVFQGVPGADKDFKNKHCL